MGQGPGFVPTFLYYFVGTTLIVTWVLSRGVEVPTEVGNPFPLAVLCGALAGGLGAFFNSHEQISVSVKNRGAFLKKLTDTLTEMGYRESKQQDGVTLYDRPAPSNLFSGKIFVQLEGKTANLSGRSRTIRRLKGKLEA
jgi:hypothetical protein